MSDFAESKSNKPFFFEKNLNNTIAEKNDLLINFESTGKLSDAELKFLALSKEKKNSIQFIKNILFEKITLNNYENIFCLKNYQEIGGTINPEQAVKNIRYRDKHGTIVATIQIDSINKKIRIQNLGDIFPKQECFTPEQIGEKLKNLAVFNSWITEDGGVNQFNNNLEYRYKDKNGNVMAAIITNPDNKFDTIVEYKYNLQNIRTEMLLTNTNGQSRVIYDGSPSAIQLTRIDIDSDGTIVEITKIFDI